MVLQKSQKWGAFMNKKKIDELIPIAYEILSETNIAQAGKINKTYRGQISSFGAALSMGNLRSAVCFFSNKGGSCTDRDYLMEAIYKLIKPQPEYKNLKDYILKLEEKDIAKVKEEVINATIALKLAMNLYKLTDDKELESGDNNG
jgi:CRISPR-associated protein Cmr5